MVDKRMNKNEKYFYDEIESVAIFAKAYKNNKKTLLSTLNMIVKELKQEIYKEEEMTLKQYMTKRTKEKIAEVVEQNVNDWGGTIDYSRLEFEDVTHLAEDLSDDDTLFELLEAEFLQLLYTHLDEVQNVTLAELEDRDAMERTYESMRGADV